MSTTPVISRFPFESHIAAMPPEQQYVIRNLWNVAFDAQTSIPILKSQIDTNKSSIDTVTSTVNNTSTASETTVVTTNTIGGVNNETSETAYVTQQSDYGAFIIMSDASAIAISLSVSPGIQVPWYCTFFNEGVGLATLTPVAGTISYPNNLAAGSMPVAQGQAAIVAFDGTNFFAVTIPVPPQNTPVVDHQWINAFNWVTGAFSQSQPAFTDISGVAAPSQLPTPTVSALGGVEAIVAVTSNWINAISTAGVPLLSQPTAADIVPASGATGSRPTVHAVGQPFFDTTLGTPIWWNSTAWVNASGTPV